MSSTTRLCTEGIDDAEVAEVLARVLEHLVTDQQADAARQDVA
jgi:hypothetical protein